MDPGVQPPPLGIGREATCEKEADRAQLAEQERPQDEVNGAVQAVRRRGARRIAQAGIDREDAQQQEGHPNPGDQARRPGGPPAGPKRLPEPQREAEEQQPATKKLMVCTQPWPPRTS